MSRRFRRNEEGAYLILWGLLLLGMLVMVAIVVDLGAARAAKRSSQRTADLAALAAGQNMSVGDDVGACKTAIQYVDVNLDDVSGLLGTPCEGAVPAGFLGDCDPLVPVDVVLTSPPYVITIRSPITDAELANYTDTAGNATIGPADGKPCERMAVSVQRTNTTYFARVIGQTNLTTEASAVVRGFIGINPKQNAGLVVLERKGCGVLTTGGGGSTLGSVLVKGSFAADGTPRPGVIQVDTKAEVGPGLCDSVSGGATEAKYAVFGAQIAPGAPERKNEPSIYAEAIGGKAGRLDAFALTYNPSAGNAAYTVPTGVSPAPTPGVIASRDVVDSVFNASPTTRVATLRATTNAILGSLEAAVAACPLCNSVTASSGEVYSVYPPPDPLGVGSVLSSGGTCSTNAAALIDIPAAFDKVYVDCPDKLDVPNIRIQGTKIALAGVLRVGSNGMASFPNAKEIYLKGCGGCTTGPGNGTKAIDADGAILINTGPSTPLSKQCNDGLDNDGDGKTDFNASFGAGDIGCQTAADWDELSCISDRSATSVPATGPARLVVAHGPFDTSSSAIVDMCQTFVLMADGANLPDLTTDFAVDPTCAGDYDVNGDFVPQPCPVNNAYKSYLKIFGTIDWTAPNQTEAKRDTSIPSQNFEDLALWTESAVESEIKGQGATVTSGVFFFPNATVNFSGQASQLIDLNAQFVARRLKMSGQGTLSMKPNPNDVVETPAPYFQLIR